MLTGAAATPELPRAGGPVFNGFKVKAGLKSSVVTSRGSNVLA
jgi:hypothetical protein